MKKFSLVTKANSRRTYLNKRLRTILWVSIFLLLLLFLLPRVVSFAVSVVISPLVMVEDWVRNSDSTLPAFFRDRSELLERQHQLERELTELRSVTFTKEQLISENERLRSLLGATTSYRIGAGVIGRPPEVPYDVVIIDKGSVDGVSKHAPVYIGREQVIGMVAETFPRSSVVILATSPGVESTVFIYGPHIYTKAVGAGGGQLRVSVPQGVPIAEGNLVVIPTFETGVYGTVNLVESVASQPEQHGYVSIDVPLSGLRYVSVGERPLQKVSFEEAKAVVGEAINDILSISVPEGVLIEVSTSTRATTSANATTI